MADFTLRFFLANLVVSIITGSLLVLPRLLKSCLTCPFKAMPSVMCTKTAWPRCRSADSFPCTALPFCNRLC